MTIRETIDKLSKMDRLKLYLMDRDLIDLTHLIDGMRVSIMGDEYFEVLYKLETAKDILSCIRTHWLEDKQGE